MTAPNEYDYLADCTIRVRGVDTLAARGCVWCGGPLTGRQLRWCSKVCVGNYLRNHAWTDARRLAVDRVTITVPDVPWYQALRWTLCDECGRHTTAPEVNHVDPRRGAGYASGCWNHQTNLQVLCHQCHVAETNRQRSAHPLPGATPEPLWVSA